MKEQLEQIKGSALAAIAGAETEQALEEVRVRFLGKKGELTAILRGMGAVAPEDRPKIGAMVNTIRAEIEESLSARFGDLKAQSMERKLREERIDVTMPAPEKKVGKLHPITQTRNRMVEIFTGMGFEIAEGPEVESTYFNFDALNAPADHPSRDDTDTFYFSENVLLRTQTSPVQIRSMEGKIPPIRMISPGRVYRSDVADATHSPMFHQCEGLVIDKGITMGDLKGTLATFAKAMFGERTRIRFRPHNFPFTEPSAEVDVSCFVCGGKGCRLCKGEGWIEILGAGMVHPFVLSNCGIDPEEYSGFAFGLGVERIAMTKYGIDDIRLFYENDKRFLEQF